MDVTLTQGETVTFEAREKIWRIADIAFASIDCPTTHSLHWEHKKKPAVDNWVVTVKDSGACSSTNDPPRRRLRIANLAARSACESEGSLIALFLPYGAVDAPLYPEIADDAAEFLADYLVLLHRNLAHLKLSNVPRIAEATTHMLAAALSPSCEKLVQAQAPIDAVITTRAIRMIDTKVADADLSPESLCRAIGVSRSRLYRIFERAGGISNYIRRRRLLKTRRMLADATNTQSISQIAEGSGFTDPSSYSRMFKREFGLSPKEARAMGWEGIQHPASPGINEIDGVSTLNTLLMNNSLGL
ncbi:helix-turn-helix domain-containing protein [Rhizobium sp. S152]|uniref:helix-turn-helix domain-containing protein n=1 Tax=Rhizobium sp. S152 TaxID=3055038 RepID=UPI0025A9D0D5|nr:helix-turn-helix domain-containing protein [Rhizobium sp. S152]MDM9625594.1 helix-turn-helix domain-containing protein [Rhizobium sp. S152]